MTIGMWIVGGLGIALLLLAVMGAGFYFFMKKKKGSKYKFLLYSRNSDAPPTTITAQVKVDKTNKHDRRFFFDNNATELQIREPTLILNGIAYREITYGPDGRYVYLKPRKLVNQDYLQHALDPEEKAITLAQLKENQKSFDTVMNKYQAYALMTIIFFIIFLIIGIIYSSIAYAKASTDHVKLAQENNELQASISQTVNVMNQISIRNAQIIEAVTGKDMNVSTTRTLS